MIMYPREINRLGITRAEEIIQIIESQHEITDG